MTESESIQAALRDFARTIGGLQVTVNTLTQQWRDQDEKASQGRRALYEKIEGLVDDIRTLEGQVKAAISDIAFMKPIVDGVIEARQQVKGAVKAGRWVHWLIFGSGGGAALLWVASHFFTVGLK
ncbi:hypothetical protein ACVI1J_009664 [Bradyrhizobium diazoefficiens]|uniref:DUF1515 family protein n=1 Tax=Bradyrhizobium diazoefficiens TaxID=1355477 RepID=UPI0015B6283B|nr:DUF1515 family protein [Bradyrhizobium diazoefficiens]QLD43826.1 DUF1515 family protein [Bradyrhizobium diazoefficiens]